MNGPSFTEHIPVDSVRVGDTVNYLSDLGGYRFGEVVPAKRACGKDTIAVRAVGRRNLEYVKLARVRDAFRDVLQDKETIQ